MNGVNGEKKGDEEGGRLKWTEGAGCDGGGGGGGR